MLSFPLQDFLLLYSFCNISFRERLFILLHCLLTAEKEKIRITGAKSFNFYLMSLLLDGFFPSPSYLVCVIQVVCLNHAIAMPLKYMY